MQLPRAGCSRGPSPSFAAYRFQPGIRTECVRHEGCDGAATGGSGEPKKVTTMNYETSFALRLPSPSVPEIECTTAGKDLDDALDAWLADQEANEDFAHVYGWNDDAEEVRS